MASVKTLPHNQDAEKSVLGAILIDKDAINLVSEFLLGSDFYDEINAVVFEAMLKLFEERKAIDLLTVTDFLKKKNNLAQSTQPTLTNLLKSFRQLPTLNITVVLLKKPRPKGLSFMPGPT